ncbi:glycosyltransferase family 2 protein [Dermabacteraceae bacterium P7074]
MSGLCEITVVMPVYNEGSWVKRSLGALEKALANSSLKAEAIVVDDGSREEDAAILRELADAGRIRLIRQENAGRLAARRRGLEEARTELTLLLDARVMLDPGALAFLEKAWSPESPAWNAHVDVVTAGNPWSAFWSAITKVGWRKYFTNPRRVSFGSEEFDSYPKGTGAFLGYTQALLEGSREFDSLFADQRFSSDDTKLLRQIAVESTITIAPEFRVSYYGRDSAEKWAKQVFFRGTTFVDGYLGDARRAKPALGIAAVGGLLGLRFARRRPVMTLLLAVLAHLGLRRAVGACGGDEREKNAAVLLAVPFSGLFGCGILRGLWMAARK